MCIAKSPQVTTAEQKVKEPTVIRNPYLDGAGPQIKALRTGRSSLRIERAGRGAATPVAPPALPLPPTSTFAPIYGGDFSGVRLDGGGGSGLRFSEPMRINQR